MEQSKEELTRCSCSTKHNSWCFYSTSNTFILFPFLVLSLNYTIKFHRAAILFPSKTLKPLRVSLKCIRVGGVLTNSRELFWTSSSGKTVLWPSFSLKSRFHSKELKLHCRTPALCMYADTVADCRKGVWSTLLKFYIHIQNCICRENHAELKFFVPFITVKFQTTAPGFGICSLAH